MDFKQLVAIRTYVATLYKDNVIIQKVIVAMYNGIAVYIEN